MKPILVGITGFSGAGKTTVAEHLERQGGVKQFRFDSFYKNEDECPLTEDGRFFWDHPKSIHFRQAYSALQDLKMGNDIMLPIYDRRTSSRIGEVLYTPAPIIFVEGLLLFTNERIKSLFDLKMFLDVPEEVATARRLERQPDYDVEYHHKFAIPAARKHVIPAKEFADVIIDGTPAIAKVAFATDKALHQHLGVLA